jgi:hypothetical protein
MLKIELHAHTNADPYDRIPHTADDLIGRAAQLGYGALAITLHDHQIELAPHEAHARARGVLLLRGIERTIGHVHVLLINYPADATARVARLEDLAELRVRHPRGLVVVPHPFYPLRSAMGRRLDDHAGSVDAIELNAMYTRQLDFNTRAVAWARARGKPIVGNTDLHRLEQMGTTWTTVDAPPDADAICDAIRAGRVELHTAPLSWPRAVSLFSRLVLGDLLSGRLPR